MSNTKIYRFELLGGGDYWLEVREIANSLSEYEFRNYFSTNGQWETMTYYPGENFNTLLNIYRDSGLYREVIAPNDIRYPSFNELIKGVTMDNSPHKCKCDIQDLMRRGCQCRGV